MIRAVPRRRVPAMNSDRTDEPDDGGTDRTRFEMRVDEDFKPRVARQAKRMGIRPTQYVKVAVAKALERDEAADPEL